MSILEYGRHVALLHRRRPPRRAHTPTHGFPFLFYMNMGLRLKFLLITQHEVLFMNTSKETEKAE